MNKHFIMDLLGWGSILWLIGYSLGILLFFLLPTSFIGWAILPIGFAATLWVLLKKAKGTSFQYYLFLGITWVLIAVTFDYLFIVKAFNPPDGYYKFDVYLYYLLTFATPLVVGLWKGSGSDEHVIT